MKCGFKKLVYVFSILIILLVLLKYFLDVKEGYSVGFCQSRDLRIGIQISLKNTSGGTINYYTAFSNDIRVTDNNDLNYNLPTGSTKNTGLRPMNVKNNCNSHMINKVRISVNNELRYSSLIITVKSGNNEIKKEFNDGVMSQGENLFGINDFPLRSGN